MIFGFLRGLEFKVPSVFISYSSHDQIKVERLAEALRQEQILRFGSTPPTFIPAMIFWRK
jgi:hypothetical protein